MDHGQPTTYFFLLLSLPVMPKRGSLVRHPDENSALSGILRELKKLSRNTVGNPGGGGIAVPPSHGSRSAYF